MVNTTGHQNGSWVSSCIPAPVIGWGPLGVLG